MKSALVALALVGLFVLVVLSIAATEGRIAVPRGACAACGDTGQVDCPSCDDGWQSRSGAGFSRVCPVCGGHAVIECPACGE